MITREEALEQLRIGPGINEDVSEEYNDAVNIAIGDIEKQIPKKPKPIDYKQYVGVVCNAEYLRDSCWCPNCHTEIRSGRYCVHCGQLLDWSDIV